MRMKLISGLVMAIAFGASAHATEFVTNGNFETVTGGLNGSNFEYDPDYSNYNSKGYVTGWSTAADTSTEHGYNILFNTSRATWGSVANRWGCCDNQDLWAMPGNTASMGIGNNFMALDGAGPGADGSLGVRGALQQTINGLTVGQTYTLTFDFAAGQLKDRQGDTTEQLQVSLGNSTQQTDILQDKSKSATNWELETMTFTATNASEVLSFLSLGTPSGDPPMALLDNVSLKNAVPEPATWGLMLVGVAGVGASLRRRRAAAAVA